MGGKRNREDVRRENAAALAATQAAVQAAAQAPAEAAAQGAVQPVVPVVMFTKERLSKACHQLGIASTGTLEELATRMKQHILMHVVMAPQGPPAPVPAASPVPTGGLAAVATLGAGFTHISSAVIATDSAELAQWKIELSERVGEVALGFLNLRYPSTFLTPAFWPACLWLFPFLSEDVTTSRNQEGPETIELGGRISQSVEGVTEKEVFFFRKQLQRIHESITMFRKTRPEGHGVALIIRDWCESYWSLLVAPTIREMHLVQARSAKVHGRHVCAAFLDETANSQMMLFGADVRAGLRKISERSHGNNSQEEVLRRSVPDRMSSSTPCRVCHQVVVGARGRARKQAFLEHNKTCRKH
jgi:hypothetical protein